MSAEFVGGLDFDGEGGEDAARRSRLRPLEGRAGSVGSWSGGRLSCMLRRSVVLGADRFFLFFCFFLDVGVNMMRCSSFSGSESLDRDLRAQIICVIPPSLSFHISRDVMCDHDEVLCKI